MSASAATITLTGLFIYPVKSLGGISVPEAEITSRGLQYDRRWLLVDARNRFLTQREHPQLALLNVEPAYNGSAPSSCPSTFRSKQYLIRRASSRFGTIWCSRSAAPLMPTSG
jgi:uncharacterized protein YcbX